MMGPRGPMMPGMMNPQMMQQMMAGKGGMNPQMMAGKGMMPGMPGMMGPRPMMGMGGPPGPPGGKGGMGGPPAQMRPQGMPPPQQGAGGALSASALAAAPPGMQKQMLGEKLFPLIAKHQPELAGKITGMMLEMDNSELLLLLESDAQMKVKVDEAMRVLEQQK